MAMGDAKLIQIGEQTKRLTEQLLDEQKRTNELLRQLLERESARA